MILVIGWALVNTIIQMKPMLDAQKNHNETPKRELYEYNEIVGSDCLICPKCLSAITSSRSIDIYPIRGTDDYYTTIHASCRHAFTVQLPRLRKRLIYLDQWFISNAVKSAENPEYLRIAGKLKSLVGTQNVAIISSDVHARESAQSPIEEKNTERWRLINDLAIGDVTETPRNIQLKQLVRVCLGEPESFPWQDAFYKNPHRWLLGTPSKVGQRMHIMSTNIWRMQLESEFGTSQELANKNFRSELERSANIVGSSATLEDCMHHCSVARSNEINFGIRYYLRSEQLNNLMRTDLGALEVFKEIGAIPESIRSRGYLLPFLKEIVEAVSAGKNVSSEEAVEIFRQCSQSLSIQLHIVLDAMKLHSAVRAIKSTGSMTRNTNKFSVNYGSSYENDAAHISYFSPYVDAMLVDNNASKLLQHPQLGNVIRRTKCQFFSPATLESFEQYIDDIALSDPSPLRQLKRALCCA